MAQSLLSSITIRLSAMTSTTKWWKKRRIKAYQKKWQRQELRRPQPRAGPALGRDYVLGYGLDVVNGG